MSSELELTELGRQHLARQIAAEARKPRPAPWAPKISTASSLCLSSSVVVVMAEKTVENTSESAKERHETL